MPVEKSVRQLQNLVHATAFAKGFHDGGNTIWKMLGNIHAEVSEAWEEARDPKFNPGIIRYADKKEGEVMAKPEGFPVELADIVIRCLDTAESFGIDLYSAIVEKMAYNATRPHRHGNKRA